MPVEGIECGVALNTTVYPLWANSSSYYLIEQLRAIEVTINRLRLNQALCAQLDAAL